MESGILAQEKAPTPERLRCVNGSVIEVIDGRTLPESVFVKGTEDCVVGQKGHVRASTIEVEF